MAKKAKKSSGVGQTIGSILVGFDQAVFRTLPPAEELVHHSRPDDPIPAGDAGEMLIVFPDPATTLYPRRVSKAHVSGRNHDRPAWTINEWAELCGPCAGASAGAKSMGRERVRRPASPSVSSDSAA